MINWTNNNYYYFVIYFINVKCKTYAKWKDALSAVSPLAILENPIALKIK